jgi:LysM repeat protein
VAGTYNGSPHGGMDDFSSSTGSSSQSLGQIFQTNQNIQAQAAANVAAAAGPQGQNTVVNSKGDVLHQGNVAAPPKPAAVQSPTATPSPLTPGKPSAPTGRPGSPVVAAPTTQRQTMAGPVSFAPTWASSSWASLGVATKGSPAANTSSWWEQVTGREDPRVHKSAVQKTTTGMAGSAILPVARPASIDVIGSNIPGWQSQGKASTPWSSVAWQQGTTVKAGFQPLPAPKPLSPAQGSTYAGLSPSQQQSMKQQTQTGTYKIKSGDTLSSIAAKLGTTVSALKSQNNIQNVNQIYAGTELKYTGGATSVASLNSTSPVPPADVGSVNYGHPESRNRVFTEVVSATGKTTIVRTADGAEYTLKGSAGGTNSRNNNPGALKFGPRAERFGAIGQTAAPPGSPDGVGYAIFPTYEAGVKAYSDLQKTKNADKTIVEMLESYAVDEALPAYSGYADDLATAAGVDKGTKISDLTDEQFNQLMMKQFEIEG